jgi:hypothetical protein
MNTKKDMEASGFGSVYTAELFRHFSVPKRSMNKADGLDPVETPH